MIRDGEIPHVAVATELYNRVMARSKAAGERRGARRQLLRRSVDDDDAKSILKKLSLRLLNHIGRSVERLEDQPVLTTVGTEMYFKLRAAVLKAAETASWKAMERAALTRVAKQVFEKTCTEWEEQLDAKLYPGRPNGTFRRECSLLDAPLDEYDVFLVDVFYIMLVDDATQQEIYERLAWDATNMDHYTVKTRLDIDLELATLAISNGVDEGSKICWECGATLATAHECTGCRAALYCGHECQRKAWKEGHNGACSNLKVKHDNFVVSLQAVDNNVHVSVSGLLEGMQPSQRFNLQALMSVHFLHAHPDANAFGEPNLKYFYENLARVIRGEWWLFDENETPSAEEFKQITRENGEREEDALKHFFLAKTKYLSYDYVGFAERNGVDDLSQLLAERFGDLQQSIVKRFGAAMPADVYLEMCRQEQWVEGLSETYTQPRRLARLTILKYLRENFHKASKLAWE